MVSEMRSTSALIRSRISAERSMIASSSSISTSSPFTAAGQERASLLATMVNGRGWS